MTTVFSILYLRKFGFTVNDEPFKLHSWYFRNALVRANYNDCAHGISATTVFLEKFFKNLLLHGEMNSKIAFVTFFGIQIRRPKVQFQSAKIAL